MAIKVTLTGRLAELINREVLLTSPKTVREAILELANMNEEGRPFLLDESGEVRDNVVIILNQENIEDLDQQLKEGDELFLILPIAGG